MNEPQERREPTFIAARDAQYRTFLGSVEDDLANAEEVIAQLKHDIQQLQSENTNLKAATLSDVDCLNRKRPRADTPEPAYCTHPKMVADVIALAKQYISNDVELTEERALPEIIMVYGEDPAKSQFNILKAPQELVYLVPAADHILQLTAADKRTGLREAAVTVTIVEYLADNATEKTIFADPAFSDDLQKAKALLQSARTPGNYEVYFLLQAVL